MTGEAASHAWAGLGVGLALASAPGPVQAVLLGEAIRGGVGRGIRAMAGANVTFGLLLVGLALGLSVAAPSGAALRVLKVAGGGLLLWLAVEGLRSKGDLDGGPADRRGLLPPSGVHWRSSSTLAHGCSWARRLLRCSRRRPTTQGGRGRWSRRWPW